VAVFYAQVGVGRVAGGGALPRLLEGVVEYGTRALAGWNGRCSLAPAEQR